LSAAGIHLRLVEPFQDQKGNGPVVMGFADAL